MKWELQCRYLGGGYIYIKRFEIERQLSDNVSDEEVHEPRDVSAAATRAGDGAGAE